MRLSSLRALILVLAMVVQTVAGGWGVARAAAGPVEAGVSVHCMMQGGSDDAGDARRDGPRHMCDSCLLCAGPPLVSLAGFAPVSPAPRAVRAAGFVLSSAQGFEARIAEASFARGPPAVAFDA